MRQYFENGAFNKCLKNAEIENAEKSITRSFTEATLRATLPILLIRHVSSHMYCIGKTLI